jgi:hypothetical protein
VVQPQETADYRAAYPNLEILPLPKKMHIGETRKWIMRQTDQNHWQMDDDVLARCMEGVNFVEALELRELHIPSTPLVGFGRQYMGTQVYEKGRFHKNMGVWHMLGINVKLMGSSPVHHFSLYEDTVMNIHAREAGGTNVDYGVLLGNASYTKRDGTGCSSYRSIEVIEQNMRELVLLYPKYCTIVPSDKLTQGLPVGKTVKTSWSKIRPL